MAHVVGLHEIELRHGADPAEFERVAAEVVSLPMFEGWTTRLLRVSEACVPGSTCWFSRSSIRRHVTGTSPRRARAQMKIGRSTSRTGRRPMPGNGCML
jgi:hypothetical protein